MAIVGEVPEEKLWDYDLPVNGNQVTSPPRFDSGESSLSPQPDYNFTSFLDEFEKDNSLALNPSMVNAHGLSSEETATTGYIPTLAEGEELPPNSSSGMMDHIPTFVDPDATLEESAPFSSLVHQIASLPNEKFLEIILGTSNVVYDHGGLSMEGNVATEETPQTPVTLSEDGVPLEQEGGLDNIPRLTATFDTSTKRRVCWTPEMHARFVRAVEQLGGCKSAKPKHILPLMNVEGLSKNHVTNHLQLYRSGKC